MSFDTVAVTPELDVYSAACVREMEKDGAVVTFSDVYGYIRRVEVSWCGNEWSLQNLDGYPVASIYEEFLAIRAMQLEGFTVLLDETSRRDFRVRIKGPGIKTISTTSTSGYPIMTAHEKWQRATGGAR